MTIEFNPAEWRKELQLLLQMIQSQPSRDWAAERDRIVVLNKLIAGSRSAA
ncbi:hypothetical protein [Sphingomonas sp.]|uniref:hypothetical protein n=1 Tax=Sphingomonas sp. TaxID=28214 RepID=UPI0025E76CB2|nr:hypothetical protein [Sphingomonas sp.]